MVNIRGFFNLFQVNVHHDILIFNPKLISGCRLTHKYLFMIFSLNSKSEFYEKFRILCQEVLGNTIVLNDVNIGVMF